MELRLLAIGDIVGTPGRRVVRAVLPDLIRDKRIDFIVANAENVASGSGVTRKDAEHLFESGVHVLTCGDHVWRRRDAFDMVATDPRMLRAANYSRLAPGRGHTVITGGKGIDVGVVHVIGRVFMQPIDCPFAAASDAVNAIKGRTRVIIVDMHCEATSEKLAMGRWLDGQVSAVFGTHTHVATADEQILPKGTGYITDVGMTGPYDSILGREIEPVMKKFVTGVPAPFNVADGDVRLCGALFTVDVANGRAIAVERIEVRESGARSAVGQGTS